MDFEQICKLMERFESSSAVEMGVSFQGASLYFRKPEIVMTANDVEAAPSVNKKFMGSDPIKAPLAGTFYRAPSPDAEPFVKVGQTIHKGDVIGIIEAMKMMNEVTATEEGVIEKILPEDGSLVAYDETIILMK